MKIQRLAAAFLSILLIMSYIGTAPVHAQEGADSDATSDTTTVTAEHGAATNGQNTVPVTLTATAATFSVTVPTSLPVSLSADGTVTTATNCKITNNSTGQIKVSAVAINDANSWTKVAFSTDFNAIKVNTKQYALKINEKESTSDILGTFSAIDGGGASTSITYDAKVVAPSSAISNATIANVVFTIGWNTAS
jgi:hypothetical protein